MVLLAQTTSFMVVTSENIIIRHDLSSSNPKSISSATKIPKPSEGNEPPPPVREVINSVTISNDQALIAISTENKRLFIFDNSLNLIKEYPTNRTASKIIFTPTTNDIIIADKTGDVYLFKDIKDGKNSPILLLGHLSTILDITMSQCGKYVITCDRDEKIRVSSYPNTYNIISFCLGHQEFVTCIKIACNNILVSASGDGTVRFWDFIQGKQLNCINTNKYIDDELFNEFSKSMDDEKVEVFTLPITDMQILTQNNVVITIVSLYKCRHLQIFKTNLSDFQNLYLGEICCKSESPVLSLNGTKLLVIDGDSLKCYTLEEDKFVISQLPQLDDFYNQHGDVLKIVENNAITMLYKRKFDNVQEYLARKKQRLEGVAK